MINNLLILATKLASLILKRLNLGSGSTWPGHIALNLNSSFIRQILKKNPNLKVVLIVGTNGKTTTSKLIKYLLEQEGIKVFHNEAGANLLNGIASSIIKYSTLNGSLKYDMALFEIDENTLPLILNEIKPQGLVVLNLFRDQLDRYGEVNSIANKWSREFNKLSKCILFANGDDPKLTYIAKNSKLKSYFFGIDEEKMKKKEIPHDVDFIYCPNCQNKLNFKKISYSHLGDFNCPKCGFKKEKTYTFPNIKSPLPGAYNIYNTNAAVLVCEKMFEIDEGKLQKYLNNFQPAFGRQEEINIDGKIVKIFLSKNPTSFNESLRTVQGLGAKNLLIVLNDRIPDGQDVSWIWDVDFEMVEDFNGLIYVSGDRVYDIGIRLKYAFQSQSVKLIAQNQNLKFKTFDKLNEAIKNALEELPKNETLYILPTYSAMLETRKILIGKKIL